MNNNDCEEFDVLVPGIIPDDLVNKIYRRLDGGNWGATSKDCIRAVLHASDLFLNSDKDFYVCGPDCAYGRDVYMTLGCQNKD
jgi:hypothetical protein